MRISAARLISLVAFSVLLASSPSFPGEPALRVSDYIAVLDIKTDESVPKSIGSALSDALINEVVHAGTYNVIDRANRDRILKEQGFQQLECVKEECRVEAGKLLGVGKIVVGSITRLGQSYIINLQVINVESARVENSVSSQCKCAIEDLFDAVRKEMKDLIVPLPEAKISPPTTAKASITTVPDKADLVVDSEKAGSSPKTIELNPGKHSIKASMKGYSDSVKELKAEAGKVYDINLKLDAIIVPPPPSVQRAPEVPGKEKDRTYSWIALAAGGVFLAAGVGLNALGDTEYNKYKSATTKSAADESEKKTRSFYTLRNVLYGLAVPALATGVVLYTW
jgi:TolB-like protein